MSGIKINSNMLTLAREANQLSQTDLAGKLGVAQSNVTRFEFGTQNISEESFEILLKTFGFTREFYLQEGSIQPPVFFRKRDKVPAKIMNALDANMNIYRLNISKILKAYELAPTNLPQYPTEKDMTPEKAAQLLRKNWKIDKGPIENLCEILEQKKIIIVSMDFGTDRVDGRSMLSNDRHPIIFVNKNSPGDRLRFTLAFEIGHLVMHTSGLSAFKENTGHEANLFAAEFLMPEKDILPDLKESPVTVQRLAELKKKWKVSMLSLLYRADSLKVLDYNQTRYLLTQFNQLKIRRREPMELDVFVEKPTLLKNTIALFKSRQKFSLKELASFFYMTEEEYTKRYLE